MVKENLKLERKKTRSCVHSKNNPNCFQNASQYFCEFCEQTSMHGFNLLGERGRTIPERIYWVIVITAAAYLSVVLVNKAYKDWFNSPVIVTFATSQLGVWDIPFPAVTICPQIKSDRTRFDYTDMYIKKENKEKISVDEAKEYEYMALLCTGPNDLEIHETEATTDEKAIEFLKEVAPNLTDTILHASWLGKDYKGENLTELFSPILTSEGVCYTFNNLNNSEIFTEVVSHSRDNYFTNPCEKSEWSIESGYSEDSEIFSSCPKRTLSAGIIGGLEIIFYALDFNIDYICREALQGHKVMLHHPAEVPRAELGYFFVPLDQSVVAAIKPNMMTTSKNLEHYKSTDRQCYFSREKSLKFFKVYNQQNCVIECLTNFTLETCGCVEFHMPRENLTPICSSVKYDCVNNAKGIFLANEEIHKVKDNSNLKNENCNCLPSCTSLDFDFEYSQADWKWQEFVKIESQTPSWDEGDPEVLLRFGHLSRVVIFFKDMQFLTSERNELKGQLELWSDFGGLLGLFMGFSFISAFEILYYLTLRLTCNIHLFGRHYWSGSKKLLKTKQEKDEIELEVM